MRIAILLFSLLICFNLTSSADFAFKAFADELDAIPQKLTLRTSGYPVPYFLLKALAYDEVAREISKGGASRLWILKDKIEASGSLSPNETTLISVPVLSRNNGKKSIKQVYVVAKNEALKQKDDDYLMISNDPEVIPSEGILFQGELKRWASARLLYYHSTPRAKSYDLVTLIKNPGDFPIEVFTSVGLGGPSNDGIYAGHVATLRFMNRLQYNAGRIIKIPPKSSYELIRQRLLPSTQTGTAIAKIWLVSGSKAKIEIKAEKPGNNSEKLRVIKSTWDDGRISYFVPSSTVDIEREFNTKDRRMDIRIGEEPVFITPKRGFDIHLGNYGLLHRIKLKLVNDNLKKPCDISLYYTAKGGLVRGVFLINGKLYETGLLDAEENRSQKIVSVSVSPKSSKNLEILMMPQPGAYYPTILSVAVN